MKTFAADIVANAYQQENQLIAQLYSAVTDPDALCQFMKELIRLLNAESCIFALVENNGTVSSMNNILRVGFDSACLVQLDEYCCHINVPKHRLKTYIDSNRYLRAIPSQAIISDEEYVKTEIYNDWSRKQNIRHTGILPFKVPGAELSFFINRSPKQGAFSVEELAYLDRLAPHFTNVLKIQKKFTLLEFEKQQLAKGLYHLKRPYFLFDKNLKVVFINRQAEQFLLHNHELSVAKGMLKARNPSIMSEINLTLSLAVSTALGQHNQSERLIKIKRDGRQEIILQISPVSMATDAIGMAERHTACAALEIYDQENISQTSQQALEDLYALTHAEARLATAIRAGQSLQEIEQATGVRINTLKTHLRAIFRKTDTSRQQELIAKLANLP